MESENPDQPLNYAPTGEGDQVDAEELGISGLEDPVLIGRGGFALVYRAYQPAFRRTVAVKVMTSGEVDDLARERFQRECQAMGLLSEHPSIVTVLDAGFTPADRPYLVMAYMPEGSLHDRLRAEGPMGWQDAGRISIKVAGALQAAHDAGILHRDVKPANVLISQYGEPQLSDFGIARIAGGHETTSGVVTASLSYAAPETIEGRRPAAASDLYSLASLTYALTCGSAPFEGQGTDSVAGLLRSILNDDPEDLREWGAPDDFAQVVERALAKDPADRHGSVAEFGEALQAVQVAHGIQPTDLPRLGSPPDLAHPPLSTSSDPVHDTRDVEELIAESTGTAPAAALKDDAQPTSVPPAAAAAAESAPEPSGPASSDPVAGRVLGNRRVLALMAVGLVVIAVGALLALRDDGGGEAATGDLWVPDPADVEAYVLDGYIGPATGGDPLDPPMVGDVGVVNPLELAIDHESARVSQCPDGVVRDLRNQDLSGIEWAGRDLRCTDFRGANLDGADLSDALMWGSDFTGVDLRSVVFGGETVQFQASVMVGVDLRDQNFDGVDWGHVDLTGADLEGSNAGLASVGEAVTLDNTTCPDGSNSDATDCVPVIPTGVPERQPAEVDDSDAPYDVDGVGDLIAAGRLDDARAAFCEGRSFSLSGVDLRGQDLSNRNFQCVDLRGALLDGAEIGGSDFTGATLADSSMVGVTASAAVQFDLADLRGAHVADAMSVGGADFAFAVATGAIFTGGTWLDAGVDGAVDLTREGSTLIASS